MKNQFDFTLTGKKLLIVWLAFLLLILLPFSYAVFSLIKSVEAGFGFMRLGLAYVGFVIGSLLYSYFFIKYTIEGVKYQEHQPQFEGKIGRFAALSILGFFLCIITLGIYTPWYMKNLAEFFVDKTSYKETNFIFQGKGGQLFVNFILYFLIPCILLSVVLVIFKIDTNKDLIHKYLYQVATTVIGVPITYLIYKWFVNIDYKDYHISWQTEFWPACLKILGQVLLMLVTFGIYAPMMYLKLYQYFAERTVAESPEQTLRFGYELEALDDFLFIWGQLLLTIVTVGVYYPWAFTKIGKRVLSKTYSEPVVAL